MVACCFTTLTPTPCSLSLFLHLRYYLPSVQAWVLVLDERSTYDLPNGRTSSHPFRFCRAGLNLTPALALAPALAPTVTLTLRLTRCVAVADGELAASTTHADGHIQACATKPGPKPVPDPKPGPKLPLPLPYP